MPESLWWHSCSAIRFFHMSNSLPSSLEPVGKDRKSFEEMARRTACFGNPMNRTGKNRTNHFPPFSRYCCVSTWRFGAVGLPLTATSECTFRYCFSKEPKCQTCNNLKKRCSCLATIHTMFRRLVNGDCIHIKIAVTSSMPSKTGIATGLPC